ncbi:hypothetical protein Tco_0435525 [Tanacetum coccineum]
MGLCGIANMAMSPCEVGLSCFCCGVKRFVVGLQGVKVCGFGKIGPSSCMVVLHESSFVVYMFADLTTSVPEVVYFYCNHSPWGLMVLTDLEILDLLEGCNIGCKPARCSKLLSVSDYYSHYGLSLEGCNIGYEPARCNKLLSVSDYYSHYGLSLEGCNIGCEPARCSKLLSVSDYYSHYGLKLSMKKLEILKKNIKFRGGLLGLKAFLKLLLLRFVTAASKLSCALIIKLELVPSL